MRKKSLSFIILFCIVGILSLYGCKSATVKPVSAAPEPVKAEAAQPATQQQPQPTVPPSPEPTAQQPEASKAVPPVKPAPSEKGET